MAVANSALITFRNLLIPRLWDVPWNSASYENWSNKQVQRVSFLLLQVFSVSNGETDAMLDGPQTLVWVIKHVLTRETISPGTQCKIIRCCDNQMNGLVIPWYLPTNCETQMLLTKSEFVRVFLWPENFFYFYAKIWMVFLWVGTVSRKYLNTKLCKWGLKS